MGFPCMNCHQDVADDSAKFFAECFLCPTCFTVAERTMQQGQRELQHLLLTLKELIRLAIVRGELNLSPAANPTPSGARTVVEAVVELAQRQKESEPCPTPPSRSTGRSSRTSTRLDVPVAGGQPSYSSTPAAGSTSGTPPTEIHHTEPADA